MGEGQTSPRGGGGLAPRFFSAASPGAATGRIVFDSADAQASLARDEACILVRRETTPDDVRGMHAADGVLTERGGITSHAAVIARGLGLPCVSGATSVTIDERRKVLTFPDGRVLREGDEITLDGSAGEVLLGRVEMLEPQIDGAFGGGSGDHFHGRLPPSRCCREPDDTH